MIKKKLRVRIFCGFKEDLRKSIDLYAHELFSSISQSHKDDSIEVDMYIPPLPKILSFMPSSKNSNFSNIPITGFWSNIVNLRLRIARYILYPVLFYFNKIEINHITDHSYGHLINFSNKSKTIITVHDLIPLLAWKGMIPHELYPKNPILFKLSLRRLISADKIICVSESTKKDLLKFCEVEDKNLVIVHNGVSKKFRQFSKREKEQAREDLGLIDCDVIHILITGNQLYKNHKISFEVISRLEKKIKKPIQLIWLGGNDHLLIQFLKKYKMNKKPVLFNNLSTEQVIALYNAVDFLFFPSLYEGFGLPPLEAMSCGTPVVCSNVPALKEIYGGYALMKHPKDIQGFVEIFEKLILNKKEEMKCIQLGTTLSKNYSLESSAIKTLEVYKEVLS